MSWFGISIFALDVKVIKPCLNLTFARWTNTGAGRTWKFR